jgi:hypothetical protein
MNFKIVYKKYYFERELFVLEIDKKYLLIYKGSGLNGGKKGRILPFNFLQSRRPRFSEARSGVCAGYIFKEIFFNGSYIEHHKKIDDFGLGITSFLSNLETKLSSIIVKEEDQNIDDILEIAQKINDDIFDIVQNNIFDWNELNT